MPDLYNQLRVDLDESVAPGTVASVKFRDQIFMEITAAERLAVTSVNGSTSIPIEVEGAPDGDIDLTIGYSHDDYESTIEDYALDDPLLGSVSLIDTNKIRLHIDPLAPAGSVIEVYAIESLVARVQVAEPTIRISPNHSNPTQDQTINSHNIASILGDDVSQWGLKDVMVSAPGTAGSFCPMTYDSASNSWSGSTGGSWGSATVNLTKTYGLLTKSYNNEVYTIEQIIARGKTYNVTD